MIDIGADLQRAYDEGYADGKRDAASPWRKVEEELPDIGKRVLVWDAGCCWLATREDDEIWRGRRYWKNTDGEWDRIENDMYWMPIEPPKEEKL